MAHLNCLIKPDGWEVPEEVVKIHGITTEMCAKHGIDWSVFYNIFEPYAMMSDEILAYNCGFDLAMMSVETTRHKQRYPFKNMFKRVDVMKEVMYEVNLPPNEGYSTPKYPKLEEAYEHFFKKPLKGAHGALADAVATVAVYREYLKLTRPSQ